MYLSFIGFLSFHEHPPTCPHAMPLHIGEAMRHEEYGFSLLTPEDTMRIEGGCAHVYVGMMASARIVSTVYALLAARSLPCNGCLSTREVMALGVLTLGGNAVVKEQ